MNRSFALACVAGLAAGIASSASAQSLSWNNPAGGAWTTGANWLPIGVPDMPGESAVISTGGSYVVTIASLSAMIDDLDITNPDATLQVEPFASITIGQPGTLTNNGAIVLNPSVSTGNSLLVFNAPSTLGGTGTVTLAGGTDDAQLVVTADVANSATHTIMGAGQISGGAQFINNGLVMASDVGFGGDLSLFANTTNAGSMRAVSGGSLFIRSVGIDNTGGEIVADGGAVVFAASTNSSIEGGTLRNTGAMGGVIRREQSGTTTLDGVTLEGEMIVDAFSTLQVQSAGITNNGTLVLNPTTSTGDAFLRAAAPGVPINGTGEILLAGGTGNDSALVGIDAASGFVNGVNHTIRGSGVISGAFVNNGTVRSETPATGDNLLAIVSNMANNGLIAAGSGSTLLIQNSQITQAAAGEILADGGIVAFQTNSNSTVFGGTLGTTANGGSFERQANGTTTLDAVTLEGQLTVAAFSTLRISNDLLNEGLIELNLSSSTGDGILIANDDSILLGSGSVLLGGGGFSDALIDTNTGATLTNSATHTIAGAGDINADLVNLGLIEAADTGFGTEILLQSKPKANAGTIAAPAGTSVAIGGITIDNTGGTITTDGGQIRLAVSSSSTIVGGTIGATNGGVITRQASGTTVLDGVTISGGDLIVEAFSTLRISNDLVNNGLIQLNLSASTGDGILIANDNSILLGTGSVLLGGGGSSDALIDTNTGATLTNSATHSITGAGDINADLVNLGLIEAADTGFGTEILLQSKPKTNAGTIVAPAGTSVAIGGITIDNTGGTITADGGQIRLAVSSSSTIVGGQLGSASGGGVVREASGTTTLDGVTLSGTLTVDAFSTLRAGAGGIINNGTIIINDTTSTGDGVLAPAVDTSITGNGTIFMGGGFNDSQIGGAAALTIGSGQTVTGDGTLAGSITMQGTIAPGRTADSAGFVEGLSALTLAPSARLEMELGGTASADHDRLRTNTIALDGTLDLSLFNAITPAIGDSFTIITTASPAGVSGAFDTVNFPPTPASGVWKLDTRANEVRVVVTCLADLSSGGNPGSPDFVLTGADFFEFLALFQAGDLAADFSSPAQPGVPDGVLSGADFFFFLGLFSAGCN